MPFANSVVGAPPEKGLTVALVIAVPFGVAAAIYVSEIAARREKQLIKPYIEFISAIPSVVLGFFGIAILGELLRRVSGVTWLAWVPVRDAATLPHPGAVAIWFDALFAFTVGTPVPVDGNTAMILQIGRAHV